MVVALAFIFIKGTSYDGQEGLISRVLNGYIEETTASIGESPSQYTLEEVNSVTPHQVLVPTIRPQNLTTMQENALVSRGTILTDLEEYGPVNHGNVLKYIVQQGDSISLIASDYNVNVNSIVWANHLRNPNDIKEGMVLEIPPVSGVIHKIIAGETVASIAKKYNGDVAKIISFNDLPTDGTLQIGQELIIPDGVMNNQPKSSSQSPENKNSTIAGRFAHLPSLDGFFTAPTQGYDWGIVHGRNGVDIANTCGTPIRAAADGVVRLAKAEGWNGGFGKFIEISHANGTETLYAHATSLIATIGDVVKQGQLIALMGTTGNSTGCHLHFEVHGARNPMAKY